MAKTKRRRTEVTGFRIDKETRELLEKIAESEDLTISDIVRRAVRMYLSYLSATPQGTEGVYPQVPPMTKK